MKRTMVSLLVVVFTAGFAVAAQVPTVASPEGHHHRGADVTFTKWQTSLGDPSTSVGASLTGVVGGDVGPGSFAGMILKADITSKPGFWLATTMYGFFGSKHSFVAKNSVTEDDTKTPITATIHGVVIWGWMKGASVTGEYIVVDPCPIPTPGNVFGSVCPQGTLHLHFEQ